MGDAEGAPKGLVRAGRPMARFAVLGHMPSCSTAGAAATEGVGVNQHPLVHAAVGVHQGDKGGEREAGGDGYREVGNAIGGMREQLVLAAEDPRHSAKLAEMATDRVTRGPPMDQGASTGGPRDAGDKPGEVAAVLFRSEKGHKQQLGLWLRPDIGDLLDLNLEVLDEEVVPLLDVDRRLDRAEVDEDRFGGEHGDVMERRILHRGAWRTAGRAKAAPQSGSIRTRHDQQ